MKKKPRICNEKSIVSSIKVKNWTATCKRMVDNYLTSQTKINSEKITDLRVRPETITFLENYIDRK